VLGSKIIPGTSQPQLVLPYGSTNSIGRLNTADPWNRRKIGTFEVHRGDKGKLTVDSDYNHIGVLMLIPHILCDIYVFQGGVYGILVFWVAARVLWWFDTNISEARTASIFRVVPHHITRRYNPENQNH
jgi:hypothetical protein